MSDGHGLFLVEWDNCLGHGLFKRKDHAMMAETERKACGFKDVRITELIERVKTRKEMTTRELKVHKMRTMIELSLTKKEIDRREDISEEHH